MDKDDIWFLVCLGSITLMSIWFAFQWSEGIEAWSAARQMNDLAQPLYVLKPIVVIGHPE